MLSIKTLKCAQSAFKYYGSGHFRESDEIEEMHDGKASEDRDDRHTEWCGKLAKKWGLVGRVQHEAFKKLLNGQLPSGQQMGRVRSDQIQHRPGYDFTFSAPKSVSILISFCEDPQLKATLLSMFHQAVRETAAWIEEHYAEARIIQDGVTHYVKTGNLAIAAFGESLSRSGDPDQHCHLVVLNMTEDKHGRIRALSSDKSRKNGFQERVFEHKNVEGLIFRSKLARAYKALGFRIAASGEHGFWELADFPKHIIKHYSSRRQEMEAAMAKWDRYDAKAAAMANLVTRPDKTAIRTSDAYLKAHFDLGDYIQREMSRTVDKQQEETPHVTRLGEALFDWLTPVVQSVFQITGDEAEWQPPGSQAAQRTASFQFAIAHLAEKKAVFTKHEILKAAVRSELNKIHASDPEAFMGILSSKTLGDDFPDLIKLDDLHYTTKGNLALEHDFLKTIERGRGTQKKLLSQQAIENYLAAAKITFTPSQRQALFDLGANQDRYMAIQGHPGVGKTTLLKALISLAEPDKQAKNRFSNWFNALITLLQSDDQERRILMTAPTNSACEAIHQASGIHAMTPQALLRYIRRQEKGRLKGALIIMDEASMMSPHHKLKITQLVETGEARAIHMGDQAQAPPIFGADLFTLGQAFGMHQTVLKDIVRQKDPELKAFVTHLIDKKFVEAFKIPMKKRALSSALKEAALKPSLKESDCKRAPKAGSLGSWPKARDRTPPIEIIVPKDFNKRHAVIADQYLHLSQRGRDETLIVIPTHQEREAVHTLIRSGLKQSGALKGRTLSFDRFKHVTKTHAELCEVDTYLPGMIVRFNRDYAKIRVRFGEYFKVMSTCEQEQVVRLERANGRQFKWRPKQFGGQKAGAIELYEAHAFEIAVGEKLLWRRSYPKAEIINSQFATVKAIDPGRSLVTITLAEGNDIQLGFDDPKLKHIDYGYTVTVHVAQGKTCQLVVVLASTDTLKSVDQRLFLVQCSRMKEQLVIIAEDPKVLVEALSKKTGRVMNVFDVLDLKQYQTHFRVADRAASVEGFLQKRDRPPAIRKDNGIDGTQHEKRRPPQSDLRETQTHLVDLGELNEALCQQIETITNHYLGPKNASLSTSQTLRFGRKGSLAIQVQGEKAGLWYDFETGERGNLFGFIQHQSGLPFKAALDEAGQFISGSLDELKRRREQQPVKALEAKVMTVTEADPKKQQRIEKLYQRSKPSKGTIVERYLKVHRHIETFSDEIIRYLPGVKGFPPSMLVASFDKAGAIKGVQLTKLNPQTGEKCPKSFNGKNIVVKQSFGPVGEHGVVISKGESGVTVIAEGVETALSLQNALPDLSVMASLGIQNIKKIAGNIESDRVIIAGDYDGKGGAEDPRLTAAKTHLSALGKQVEIILPESGSVHEKVDFNDVHRSVGLDRIRACFLRSDLIKPVEIMRSPLKADIEAVKAASLSKQTPGQHQAVQVAKVIGKEIEQVK